MIKLTFCLHRLPHLSHEAFCDYWYGTHAPLVKSVAGTLNIRRYVQSHGLGNAAVDEAIAASRGAPAPFDGVAELWWDDLESMMAPGATEEGRAAGQLLLEDEQKFIDLARSPLWFNEEKVIIG